VAIEAAGLSTDIALGALTMIPLVMCINGMRHGFFGDVKSYVVACRQGCESCGNHGRKKLYDTNLTIL